MYPQHHIPDIDQRDDANDIAQVNMGWTHRAAIRYSRRWILTLIIRRLDRQLRMGRINSQCHAGLINVMRRTFLEDTNA